MALLQALTTGVTGMINHQLILDTTANNLANVNTPGFKSSRVDFATSLNQTNFGGSAPTSIDGGRNPEQLGLGVTTGAVDVDFSQGSLQSTGRNFDLAISGRGFFQMARVDSTGNATESFFSRVGNLTFDKDNNLVDQSTGLKVLGKQTDPAGTTLGNLIPINTTDNQSLDAVQTKVVNFQGNLSSAAGALQGPSLTTAFPLLAVDPNNNSSVANENTVLSQTQAFNLNSGLTPFTIPASPDRTIYVVGTKPNGDSYAGQFDINPWTNTVQDLMNSINTVFSQGNNVFGQVTLSNGVMTAAGIGDGKGFSLFLGERNPIQGTANLPAVGATPAGANGGPTSTVNATTTQFASFTSTVADAGAYDPTFTINGTVTTSSPITIKVKVGGVAVQSLTLQPATYNNGQTFQLPSFPNVKPNDAVTYEVVGPAIGNNLTFDFATVSHGLDDATGVSYSGVGVARTIGSHTVQAGEAGLLQPTFTIPADTYGGANGTLRVAVKINGVEVGTITPTGVLAAPTAFSLSSYPHVKVGDVVSYEVSGNKATAAPITTATQIVADNNSSNLTSDTDADGIPDMFQSGSSTDINAWQYEKASNATMDWYRIRFSPAWVTSSIPVFDKNGGSHILQAAFLRTGTESTTQNGLTSVTNDWDMLLNVKPEDGQMVDDLVAGVKFDDKGRFKGAANLGSTAHGTAISDSNIYVGTPIDNSIRVNWRTTGTSVMNMDLGTANSTNGLTGFGTGSTAAAINQDGNANGALASLSVSPNGNIIGLYSNGKSVPLYQVQVATFANPGGLTNSGNNLWQVSSNSGDPIVRQPGTAGSGAITAGALEGSNVDIASEFTRLITAQRGFQVNARVIQTADSILQELAGLIHG